MTTETDQPDGAPPIDLAPLADAALPPGAPGAWIAEAINATDRDAAQQQCTRCGRSIEWANESWAHCGGVDFGHPAWPCSPASGEAKPAQVQPSTRDLICQQIDQVTAQLSSYAAAVRADGDTTEAMAINELQIIIDMARRILDQPHPSYRVEKIGTLIATALELEADHYRRLADDDAAGGLIDEAQEQAEKIHLLARRTMAALATTADTEPHLPALLASDLQVRARNYSRWVDSVAALTNGNQS